MKNILKRAGTLLLIAGLLSVSGSMFAQKIKLRSGDLSYLKGEKEILVKFTYDHLKVGKMDAEAYVSKKVKEKNKKKPGSGDEWKKKWENDLYSFYPKHFIKHFNLMTAHKHVQLINEGDAKYMFIVHTTFIEPGYDVGISSTRASVNMEVTLVAADQPDKPLAVITITKASSSGAIFSSGFASSERIAGCYELAGEYLGNYFIRKKTF